MITDQVRLNKRDVGREKSKYLQIMVIYQIAKVA